MSDDVTNKELRDEIREVATSVASIRTAFEAHRDEIKSDIRELRGSGRRALGSVTDLKEQIAKEKLTMALASRAAWMSWVIKVGTGLLMSVMVGVVGWIIGRGGVK